MAASAQVAAALPRRVVFVTGRLAEPALRRLLEDMSPPFSYDVSVLGITVAALMTTPWIARHLSIGEQPVWDPRGWADGVKASRSLRSQLSRARNKGVTVRVVGAEEIQAGRVRVTWRWTQ